MPVYQPIYGNDAPGNFDEDQSAIDRRRLQLLNAMKSPIGGAGTGWAGGIANFLQNAVGSHLVSGEEEKSRNIAKQRAAFADAALEKYGNLKDTPAVPEQNPSVPPPELEQTGGGPPLPTNYQAPPPDAPAPVAPPPQTPDAQIAPQDVQQLPQQLSGPQDEPAPMPDQAAAPPPIPQPLGGMVPQARPTYEHKDAQPMIPVGMSDKLKLLSQVAQGGPMYAKIADKVMSQVLEAPEKEAARKAAVEDRKAAAAEAARVREHETELKRIDREREEAYRAADRENQNEQNRIAAKERADQAAQTQMTIASMRFQGKSGGADNVDLTPEATTLAAEEYNRTGKMPALARSVNDMKAIINRAAAMGTESGVTPAETVTGRQELKAVVSANNQLTKDLAFIRPYVKLLDTNAAIAKDLAKKVVATDARLANRPLNWLRQNVGDNPDVAEFLAQTHFVVTEASRVLTNPRLTGQLTDTARKEMQGVLDGSMTLNAFNRVVDRIMSDSHNRVSAMESEASKLQTRLGGGKGAAPSAAPAAAPAAADSAVQSKATAAWGSYDPDKYDYRIGPNGVVQRKLK